ncbi:cysteine/glutathione ABC transporter ATP-binding protein/permease CydC [Psychromonas sp. 14N.309.X.WAT.B.A12]|uniref:heme ABC transporter ATP-binding protein/permease CydC n=1 Tax=Psychromonas sp. 14N.309.X.WAT.B.A12 TaxID=2998322 RepID=UPI0025B0056C|nr:cysteine/glutathione ABC transporter ATP-binding protein/permease CydC [Psychromonas sp. 14N.309.X.WAT.B.A12]MDN2663949.1 cysteine/glutathione ABC transporter ATP-binding protein/permease CydC [Psychromonas sp. 14N.309.X.WAT.B.A12]
MTVLLPFIRLFKKQWLMMSVGLLLSVIAVLAGIGLLSLSGWFLSASAVAGLTLLATQSFNYFTPAGGVRFLSILRTASRYGERLATHQATFKLLTQLRVWAWQKLLPLSASNMQGKRQGEILNRLVSDIDTLDHLYLRLLTPLFSAFFVLLAMFFFLAWFDLHLAIILTSSLLVLWLVLPVLFYFLGRKPGVEQLQNKRQYRVQLLSFLQGFSEISLFSATDRFRQQLAESEQKLLASQQMTANVMAFSQALLILCHGFIVLSILYIASSGVGEYQPPGALLAMVGFMALASIEILLPISGAFQHLSSCINAATRVNDLLEQTPDIVFNEQSTQSITRGNIHFKDIQFSYQDETSPQASTAVLNNINLTIKAGEKVALLGKTGCGKSTLLSLITREWEANSGSIMLDGTAIEQYSQSALTTGISVVSQRVYIFSGTLRDNLTLAQPNTGQRTFNNAAEQKAARDINDQVLASVLNKVGLSALMKGEAPFDMWLGEGGRQLSGGEQRRIGVARALLHDAPILLLDEPTEGLDKRTERDILKLLFEFAEHKTLLMISHRLTAMDKMDNIYLMEQGTLRNQGTHQTLIKTDDYYACLHKHLC